MIITTSCTNKIEIFFPVFNLIVIVGFSSFLNDTKIDDVGIIIMFKIFIQGAVF